jgi:hypothetical protein
MEDPMIEPVAHGLTRHQIETALSDIRREMARLKRREAQLIGDAAEADLARPRPGWPMRRSPVQGAVPSIGAMISTSEPSRIAV